jgi:hypothetical protein
MVTYSDHLNDQDDRLFSSIGLSISDINVYRDLFIQNNEKYGVKDFQVPFEKQHWVQRKGIITNSMLFEHFNFRKQISRFAYKWTDYVAIDLDLDCDILDRYALLIQNFMKPSFLIQSSEAIFDDYPQPLSGGLHAYYLFQKRHQTERVINGIKNYLQLNGLHTRSGYIEIRPTERCSLRLPIHSLEYNSSCPNGSHLLNVNDPTVLFTIDGFPPTFHESIMTMQVANRYDFTEFLKFTDPPKPIIQVSKNLSEARIGIKCDKPVTPGSRNEIWMEWVRDLTWAGFTGDEIYNEIISRMDDPKWNHGSNDWTNNQNKVLHELRGMIRLNFNRKGRMWSDKQFEAIPLFFEFTPLGISEISFLFDNTLDPVKKHYDIRKQQFIFNLLMLLKSKFKNGLKECPIASNVFSRLSTHQSTRNGNKALVEYAIEIGILELKTKYIWKEMPSIYSFEKFHFDLTDNRFEDLFQAIRHHFINDINSIRKHYTRSACNQFKEYWNDKK